MIGRILAGAGAVAILGVGLANAVPQEPTLAVAMSYVEDACTGEGTQSTFKQIGARTERLGSNFVIDNRQNWLVTSAPYGGEMKCGAAGYWSEIHVPIREVKFRASGGKVEISCLDARVGRDACIRLVGPSSCASPQMATKDVDDRMTMQCQQAPDRVVRALERWQELRGGPITVQDDPFAR